jgi:hypothetical protein
LGDFISQNREFVAEYSFFKISFTKQNGKFSSENKSLAQGYCVNMVISKMFSLKFNDFGTFFSQKSFV